MEEQARGAQFPQPNRNTQFNAETHVAIRQNYTAMVENIDRWVGRYVEALRRRGELDNTLIVFSSDHCEMLGDHNRWRKEVPYQQSVGVPMVVAGPGIKAGVVSDALVSVIDLAATFLDYGGLAAPKDMDSRSLRPLLEARTRSHRECVRSGLNQWRMIWDGRYKLIAGFDENSTGGRGAADAKSLPPILFDHERDVFENENVASREAGHLKRLMGMLHT
jgi:arylsulfatase